ncbi:MAG TPA: sigma-70 family RNA polymerase sigma factor [Bacteroidetes bacterium]|nr:sigma-70 family RNA polymerase sigma factor [Bacteroidota bacterium]
MGPSISRQEESTDLDLIDKYKETGDNRYVGELFQRYTHLLLGTCIKYLKSHADAQDAMMDIFEELLKKLEVHEVSNFKSWLYSLTRNHCLMKIRKMKGISLVDIESEKIQNRFMESPTFEHLDSEAPNESELLTAALAQLKGNQKQCVELFYLKEKSYKQVAEITGFEMKKVKSYIQNGKRNLYLILSKTHKA